MNELTDLIKKIKQHPHIVQKIEIMWGTQELNNYLLNLMLDTRDGQRKGFSREVAITLNEIIKLNDKVISKIVKIKPLSPWDLT
jgi:DNA-directed RNA polymerase subunit F